jgi:murein DD-endopeptidase MepM/ murein hydrolase activator NlpD
MSGLKLSVLTLAALVVGCSSTSSVKPEQAEVVYIPVPKVRYMSPDPVGQLFNDGPRRVVIYPPDIEPLSTLFSDQKVVEPQPVIIRSEIVVIHQPAPPQQTNERAVAEPSVIGTTSTEAIANQPLAPSVENQISMLSERSPPTPARLALNEDSPQPTAEAPVPVISTASAMIDAGTISPSNATLVQQPLTMKQSEIKAQEVQPSLSPLNAMQAMNGLKPNSGTWPITGKQLNVFGAKSENGEAWRGLVIAGKQQAPVGSIEAGKVVFAQPLRGYGNTVIVDHGKEFMSVYSYNDQMTKNVGDTVQKGEKIASVGKSGPINTPALYFEVRQNGLPINPSLFLK